MALSFKGYVLEKPRVGSANSPFTSSPDNVISNSGAYTAVFGTDESNPGRCEYLTLATSDGDLPEARFGWTKNESGVQRFDYDGASDSFRTLPGTSRQLVGALSSDSNTTRIQVSVPTATFSVAPYRVSVGSIGSGITFAIQLVLNDAAFTTPTPGTVQLSRDTGNLNWLGSDLASYDGSDVYFQRQSFFSRAESTGRVGLSTATLVINPIPGTGQKPLIRFGYGLHLVPVERSGEGDLSADPAAGTVEWARATGMLRFHSADVTNNATEAVYYDGVLLASELSLPRQTIGTIGSPSSIVNVPSEGGDLIFRAKNGSIVLAQFPETLRVTDFASGKTGQVQVKPTGDVQFSSSDVGRYGSATAEVIFGDLPLERGLSIRFFRSPVDLEGKDPSVKDVSTFVAVEEATLADPILAAPQVFLPVLPIDDSSYPVTISVEKGTGTYSGQLPRLDVLSPPAGIGYVIDFDERQLLFSRRKNNQLTDIVSRTAAVQLPDTLVHEGATFEINQGSGFEAVTLGVDALLDFTPGILTFIARTGVLVIEGASATVSDPSSLVDSSADFVAAAVQPGDLVLVPSGDLAGVYTVTSVATTELTVQPDFPDVGQLAYQVYRGKEVLADRFFQELVLVDPQTKVERIRSSVVTQLTQGVDYKINADLGFIQFTERMLSGDEVRVTYASESDPETYVQERGTFLVRKEVVEHPVETSSMEFNQAGKTVASVPYPAVFRGGRPQTSSQVSVSISTSTIVFLPDVIPTPGGALAVTDALPHGPIVQPNERVLVDYYVYEALGGENTITVLNSPISLAKVSLVDGENSFELNGNWVSSFPIDHLLRVGTEQVYYITSADFSGGITTVTVSQPFQDDFQDPKLFVSSGPIRLIASGINPAYFMLETSPYDAAPRGMNRLKIQGAVSGYDAGSVLYFTVGSAQEFYLVTASKYDDDTGRTEVTLASPLVRQYSSAPLRRSVRPIFESGVTDLRTSEPPLVTAPATSVQDAVILFRQVEGSPGSVLGELDYSIDDSGRVVLKDPLLANEQVSALYSRYRFVEPGILRSSYTSTIVPSVDNGLLNQKLVSTLTTYLPDSFYFRVETMSTYRSEIAELYKKEAQSAAPSGGPRTSNTASPQLKDQGSESVFFAEGALANEDIIARGSLKFYNDSINHLEDLLKNLDGRVVGDHDGKFKFDGTTGTTVASFADADNQIDDRIKLSDFPIDRTPPLFPLKFKGTYLRAYEPSSDSRFYPTFHRKFGYTIAGLDTNAKTGDAILDFEVKNLTGSYPTLDRRSPRTVVTQSAVVGSTVLSVASTNQVDSDPVSPAFANGMLVVIQDPSGSFLVPQNAPLEVQSKTSTTLTFTAGLPQAVPIGASVYLADTDTEYRKSYRIGSDITLDREKGYGLYVKPYPPFDGSVGGVPAELQIQTPNAEELLETGVYSSNSSTSPYRFPALDGLALDDDGDYRLPLINPSPQREFGTPGYLETERRYLASGTGVFATSTVDPFVGVGNIGGGGFTITLTAGTFPSPVPQIGDLVRTLSGVNGQSSFHRVSGVTTNSLTVDVGFTVDTNVDFLVTVADNLEDGTFTTLAGAVVTDLTANFISAGVKRGHTVVCTQPGTGQYERRQVLSINSATQLTLTSAFTNVATPLAYRVHNPLNTFSDIADLSTSPTSLLGVLQLNADSEINAIDAFLSEVLTDRLSLVAGNASGTTLTGVTDFVAAGVQPGDYVYVTPIQTNQGFYLVEEVVSATSLKVTSPFPSGGAMNFRVVQVTAVSEETLDNLVEIRTQAANFYASSLTWASVVSTVVPVVVPPGSADATYFARGYTPTDISTRRSQITARIGYVPNVVAQVEATLASSDRLYDKRYVWIDARVNLEKGTLVRQSRAREDRLKAQQDVLKQLTKLLAVQ